MYIYIHMYMYRALGPLFSAAEARVRAFSAFGVQEAAFGVHPQCCCCPDVGRACAKVPARAWGASVSHGLVAAG